MERTVVALYNDLATAQHAVNYLINNGFERENISLLANDAQNQYSRYLNRANTQPADSVEEDAVPAGAGATFGAIVGAVVGALVSVGALVIPGIGPVLAAGPLATSLGALGGALVGAGAGAVTGGITAALIKSGVPEEQAEYYSEGVRQGGTLVAVHTDDSSYERAQNILEQFGPVDIQTRAEERSGATSNPGSSYRSTDEEEFAAARLRQTPSSAERANWSASDRPANIEASGYPEFITLSEDFRQNFESTYRELGYTYEQYLPIYRYGYDLATSDQYRDRDWDMIVPDIRRDWERSNPNSPWERFEGAVRYAWDRVRRVDPAQMRR